MFLSKYPKGYSLPSRVCQEAMAVYETVKNPRSDTYPAFLAMISKMDKNGYTLLLNKMAVLQAWMQSGVSTFVSEDFARGCQNTDCLDTIRASEILCTFPLQYFCLPDKCPLITTRGTRLQHIFVHHTSQRPLFINIGGRKVGYEIPGEGPYLIIVLLWPNGCCSTISLPLDKDTMVSSLLEAYKKPELYIKPRIDPEFAVEEDTPEYHEEAMQIGWKAAEMVFNLLLLMQSKPSTVVPIPSMTREFNRKKILSYAMAAPRGSEQVREVLCEGRRITNVVMESSGYRDVYQSHWRRGHWRRQQHGDAWVAEHPDVPSLSRVEKKPDGTEYTVTYHLQRIEPVYVLPSGTKSHEHVSSL